MMWGVFGTVQGLSRKYIGEICTTKLLELDFSDMHCNKMLLSKMLSLGIVAGGLVVKVPQIIKIMKNRSAEGLSLTSLFIEIFALLIAVAYNVRKGFPFLTFGESLFILAQNVILFAFLIFFAVVNHKKSKVLEEDANLKDDSKTPQPRTICHVLALGMVALWICFVAAVSQHLFEATSFDTISKLQSSTIALLLTSRIPQIFSNWRAKSTGQLSLITCALIWAGSMARVFTTIQEIRDQKLILSVSLSALLNSIIMTQIFAYWENTPNKIKVD